MIRRTVGLLSAIAFVVAAVVWLTGGTTSAVAGLRVSSTDPVRPFVASIVLAVIYALLAANVAQINSAAAVASVAIVALGVYTAIIGSRLRVFPEGEGERRYATIAQLVAQATEPSSTILASIHAGPLRYYAGRDTMRFDLLNEEWLDRAVAWLAEQGRHPYILIEDWEIPVFERRFAAASTWEPAPIRDPQPRCPLPATPARLTLKP